jgi:hypothetical protein
MLCSWQKNLHHRLETYSVLAMFGNVDDLYVWAQKESPLRIVPIEELVARMVRGSSGKVRAWDPYLKARDISITSIGEPEILSVDEYGAKGFTASVEPMLTRMEGVLRTDTEPRVWFLRFTESWLPYRASASPEEAMRLVALQRTIESMHPRARLILSYCRESDIPLPLSSMPQVAVVAVPSPGFSERDAFWKNTLFPGDSISRPASTERRKLLDGLVNLTDGLPMRGLGQVVQLARTGNHGEILGTLSLSQWDKLIRRYKFGDQENPYEKISLEDLDNAKVFFEQQEGVKGQDHAVNASIQLLWKARTSVGELLHGATSAPPRGVLFFCGPTGVGKTLIAKKIAKFCFGSEDAFLRIDMSEYQQDFTVSGLIGSPPGYVGHERGGALTAAVIEKPFLVVLFDEVEKAHPRVFDILLQLLSDGRLTDARGQTAYFSESIVIFTSNIGTRANEQAQLEEARLSKDPERVRDHFRRSVENFFRMELGRPELLNRIGSNIVPFNFLDDAEVAKATVRYHLDGFSRRFREKYEAQPALNIADDVVDFIASTYGSKIARYGGRAVLNTLDEILLPELARRLLFIEMQRRITVATSTRIEVRVNDARSGLHVGAG